MSIQYSGTIINTTFLGDTKQHIINGMETALLSAGWTTISGHNTTNLLMQTVATPQGLQMQFRFKDNGGTCVQISVLNLTGTVASLNTTNAGAVLIPTASPNYQVVCNPYQFFVFIPGTLTARSWAAGGVPWVPSFISSITTQIGWIMGVSASDSDSTLRNNGIAMIYGGYSGNCAGIYGASLMDLENNGSNPLLGMVQMVVPQPECVCAGGGTISAQTSILTQWASGDFLAGDPLIAWADTSTTGIAKIRGQIWDSVYISGSFVFGATATFGGHNWQNTTSNNAGNAGYGNEGTCFSGGLWLALT